MRLHKTTWQTVSICIMIILCSTVVPAFSTTEPTAERAVTKEHTTNTLKITILAYKEDGTIEHTTKDIPHETFMQFKQDMDTTSKVESHLSIFKKYDLIPDTITASQLKEGMRRKAKDLNLSNETLYELYEKLDPSNHSKPPTGLFSASNINCDIYGDYLLGFRLLAGTSALTGYINFWIWMSSLGPFQNRVHHIPLLGYIKSVDMIDISKSIMGTVHTENGLKPTYTIEGVDLTMLMLGFVGYYIIILSGPILTVWGVFSGYSVFTYTRALV